MLIQGFVRVLHLVLERLSTTNAELSRVVEIDWFEPSKSCPFKSEIAGQHACQNENQFLSVATAALPIHFVQQVMEGLATGHLAHWGELNELSYSRSEEKHTVETDEVTYPLKDKGVSLLDVLRLLNPELNDTELRALREELTGRITWKCFRQATNDIGKFHQKGTKGRGEKLYPVNALLEYARKSGLWDGKEFPTLPRELKRLQREANS